MKATIKFDGGCRPTNPGNKYGSFQVVIDDSFTIQRSRFELGHGTNNEAEFDSLLFALRELSAACSRAYVNPIELDVEIFTDSMIVKGWIQKFDKFNPAKVKNERRLAMSRLAGQCCDLLSKFKSHSIEWNGRACNVETFGH